MFRVALSGDVLNKDGSIAYPDIDLKLLNNKNLEWEIVNTSKEIEAEELEGFDALILLGHRFTKKSVPKNKRLSIIARFGVGYDSVDLEACNSNSIALVITPDGIRRPVAVSVMAFILSLTGNMLTKDRITRSGKWNSRSKHMGTGLIGKKLGFIGFGNIGGEVIKLAKAFDMSFLAYDPYADKQKLESLKVKLVDINTVFKESDIISVNCALTDETKHIVNAEKISMMKNTSYLINTSRGLVVDQKALYNALILKKIAGAGLDVFEKEPPDIDDEILKLDNVILAPHSLCWTDEMFYQCGRDDIEAVKNVMIGQEPKNIVNKEILKDQIWLDKLLNYKRKYS